MLNATKKFKEDVMSDDFLCRNRLRSAHYCNVGDGLEVQYYHYTADEVSELQYDYTIPQTMHNAIKTYYTSPAYHNMNLQEFLNVLNLDGF